MNTLTFEKISQFDRRAEPVTVSIPFAAGKIEDPASLAVRDGDGVVPSQARSLATWPDGSIKWLLVHCRPDLPGNRGATLTFDVAQNTQPASAGARHRLADAVTLRETDAGIRVDTGPLSFLVPNEGFLPVRDVQLGGVPLWDATPFDGFKLGYAMDEADATSVVSTATGPVSLTVEEAGPLRAVIVVEGKHHPVNGSDTADDGVFDFRGRVTAYAGKPYIEVEHQFIHAEEAETLDLRELTLDFVPAAATEAPTETPDSAGSAVADKPAGSAVADKPAGSAVADKPAGSAVADRQLHLALGQGYYRTTILESDDDPLEMALTTETILYQANEHFIDSFYGDFWVDWRDETGGMTLSLYQAHQNFPKALRVAPEGITCRLYPPDAPPAPVIRGMAKTHRVQLHFHGPETPLQDLSVRSLQFQLPDRPALSRDWFRKNNPWLETFFPAQVPNRLLTFLNRLHDGRPKALGMFHFGDAPDAGYTNQGRGQGQTVFVNNEYDRPHACALCYALTGQRRVLDSALVSARHWLDVDLCHYDPDPLVNGGLKIHTRYHVTGKVTPSHEWTEGLLDYYFLTGREEGLAGARSVAENILRHLDRPEMRRPGATSVREGGWAMRALVGMYIGTGEERWRTEARKLAELYLDWFETYGALLAPYTSHSMPRVPFMISLTVNSFARYLLIEEDADLIRRVEQLIVATVDDVLEHCIGPDGIAYYKELPSLRRTAPTYHLLEALTHVYRITGEDRYLKMAARQFAAMGDDVGVRRRAKYADQSGAVIDGEGGGRIFADKYASILLFAGAAAPLGLLEWYEYPY